MSNPNDSHASPNRLARVVAGIERLPAPLRPRALSWAFGSQVRFVATAGIRIECLEAGRAVMHLANRRKVQNHIGGVHAAAMALLAETATGAVLGMNVPDTHLPLLKTMHVDYLRRAQGGLTAVATLDESMRRRIVSEDRGELVVPCTVTDESGAEPIACAMTWAWVPKRRS